MLYAITNSEGIIKVTGEVGSGKTMLCRMLLEKFPEQVEAVYLANPSLSREEMLYAIADGLNLNLEGQRVNIILQTLQNHLELKITQGKRVVILVDEAHAMPLDTMEELRLLYNLQVGNHKLLHIVLFGQPELNDKLNQPNMRQLKDRIIHHFSMLPLSQNIIESYLLFRMRTAGYRGPTPFSAPAAALIGKASQGLMRRVNILADKALLAAFVENTHGIEVRHVQAAIRDTELGSSSNAWWKRKNFLLGAGITSAAAIAIAASAWFLGNLHASQSVPVAARITVPITRPAAAGEADNPAAAQLTNDGQEVKLHMSPTLNSAATTATPAADNPAPAPATPPEHAQATLLEQRLEKTRQQFSSRAPGSASIQLYYTDNAKPARIEAFLKRADTQGALDNIYIFPIKINGRKGYRVLYGVYASSEIARSGIRQLPQRFRDAFAPTIFLLEDLPVS